MITKSQHNNNILKLTYKITEISEKLAKKMSLGIDCCGELSKLALLRSYLKSLKCHKYPSPVQCIPIVLDREGVQASGGVSWYLGGWDGYAEYNSEYYGYLLVGDQLISMEPYAYLFSTTYYMEIYSIMINENTDYQAEFMSVNLEGSGEEVPSIYHILLVNGINYSSDNGIKISEIYFQNPLTELPEGVGHWDQDDYYDEQYIEDNLYFVYTLMTLLGGVNPVEGNGYTLEDANCTTIGTIYTEVLQTSFNIDPYEYTELDEIAGFVESNLSLYNDDTQDRIDLYSENVPVPFTQTEWEEHLQRMVDYINSNTLTTGFSASLNGVTITLTYTGANTLEGYFVYHVNHGRDASSIGLIVTHLESEGEVPGVSGGLSQEDIHNCLTEKEVQTIQSHITDLTGLCFNNNCN
jgi:hypothetical protein